MIDRISIHGSYFGRIFDDTLLLQTFVEAARKMGVRRIIMALAKELR